MARYDVSDRVEIVADMLRQWTNESDRRSSALGFLHSKGPPKGCGPMLSPDLHDSWDEMRIEVELCEESGQCLRRQANSLDRIEVESYTPESLRAHVERFLQAFTESQKQGGK